MSTNLSKPFLIALVIITLIACYFVFQPFLTVIAIAAILATIFYKPYEKLTTFLRGQKNLAALLMCLFLVVIIILPTVKMVIYTADKSVLAYTETAAYFNNHNFNDVLKTPFFVKLNLDGINLEQYNNDVVKNVLLDFLKKSSNWMLSGATSALMETTNFIVSLTMIILTMFFFFVDGKKMLTSLMYLLPLKDYYNKEIFNKFREVSYTTMVSTFVVAIAQGIVGAIGFAFVGFPVFLAGVLVALLSLLPYVGSMIFYVPVGIYYLLVGQTWQGIFILLWGFLIIGTIDNVIRAWMLKDKAQINPIFIVFSVLGGIMLFGFWGVVLGPLVVAITATILHIYSLEFAPELDAVSENGREIVFVSEKPKVKKLKHKKK
jgi:predicted PurR-regulated permease PerM